MGDRNVEMARRVAGAVARAGGRTFYVGGCVRDALMGREVKDIDIEVHGVSVKALEEILDGLGERTAMGASFGVMGLRHYALDIAMPRSERATGRGHKDFEVFVDPFIGPMKAALRRDFTMNALMRDVLSGELLDFFGGRGDIAERRIRHVSDATFAEDPLRVFRAAQFAARFDFEIAPQTVALCARMAVDALAPERVLGELEKALGQAARPSVFFEALRAMHRLAPWFAELERLDRGAWRAAMAALDAAAALREEAREPLHFMLAALCCRLGEADAQRLTARLTNEARAARYVLNMGRQLCAAEALMGTCAHTDEWMALYDGAICPEDLILLEGAVRAGSDMEWARTEAELRRLLALYRERMAKPFAMGRDLVGAGMKPGPGMGRALERAHRLRLSGATKAEQIEAALAEAEGLESGARRP